MPVGNAVLVDVGVIVEVGLLVGVFEGKSVGEGRTSATASTVNAAAVLTLETATSIIPLALRSLTTRGFCIAIPADTQSKLTPITAAPTIQSNLR